MSTLNGDHVRPEPDKLYLYKHPTSGLKFHAFFTRKTKKKRYIFKFASNADVSNEHKHNGLTKHEVKRLITEL